MLSRARIKQVRALEMKKYRDAQQMFVAEGNKLVADLMKVFECEWIAASPSWIEAQPNLRAGEVIEVRDDEMRKVSLLKTPQDVLAVFKRPAYYLNEADPAIQLVLALDGIQDPGNLGTIVRLADWFGIAHVVCSTDTADVFGPKAVQATMGALAHVQIHYTDLAEYLKRHRAPCYGTFLDGENIYRKSLSAVGILVMGNEGNGIRPHVEAQINERLFIPNFPEERTCAESLNVAVAAAVVCAEFRRQAIRPPVS
ncbi:RNA methyltransferase [Tannerella sp.]|uniref:RNA methyltransferase n=1 Tax=Tannerella sp. TaxID=2382127 RepID=UPI0026DD8C0D|nr:RNA methyltransferase [Tannerella sp.]MDO4704570.1 RNA methyltransferase [Tannerella sp.]